MNSSACGISRIYVPSIRKPFQWQNKKKETKNLHHDKRQFIVIHWDEHDKIVKLTQNVQLEVHIIHEGIINRLSYLQQTIRAIDMFIENRFVCHWEIYVGALNSRRNRCWRFPFESKRCVWNFNILQFDAFYSDLL